MSIGMSSYLKRLIARRGDGGRSFKGLGYYDGKGDGPILPSPKPLQMDYFRNYGPVIVDRWDRNLPVMKHEDPKVFMKFQAREYQPPKLTPRLAYLNKRNADMVKKYDHYKMNYTGWNE